MTRSLPFKQYLAPQSYGTDLLPRKDESRCGFLLSHPSSIAHFPLPSSLMATLHFLLRVEMTLGASGGDLLDRFRIEMERDIGCILS